MEHKGRKLVTMFVASAALLGLTGCDDDDDDMGKVKIKPKVKQEREEERVPAGYGGNYGVSDGKKLHTPPSTKSSGG